MSIENAKTIYAYLLAWFPELQDEIEELDGCEAVDRLGDLFQAAQKILVQDLESKRI